jgi:hypothetical protein
VTRIYKVADQGKTLAEDFVLMKYRRARKEDFQLLEHIAAYELWSGVC